ncbi:MAG: phage tail protein [Campylobacteraceae bacterium]
MWWNLIYFVVLAIISIATYYLTPKAKMDNAKRPGLDGFDFPTNSNARVIPEIFGRVEVHGNIIYSGARNPIAINVKSGGKTQTVGYAIFFDMAYALCGKIDKFISLKKDSDIVATPNLTQDGSFIAKTGNSADLQGSGYSTSQLRIYLGDQTEPDAFLHLKTGSKIAYNGVSYIVFENAFVGDNVTSAPNYSAIVERTNLIQGWNYSNINGDANPAHILFYILTKLASFDEDMIDKDSFGACAKTLFEEGLGMSFTMSNEDEAKEWCEEILRTIDGEIQTNQSSGKLKLILIRNDYNINTLKTINEALYRDVTYERKSWEDTYSKITVKYTNRNTFKEDSITGTNDVALANLGYEKSQSIEFMGLTNTTSVNLILSRLFRKMANPLATVKFKISLKDFPNINTGDVYSFSNNALGVSSLIIRVLSIGADKEDDQSVEVEALEDIFSIGNMVISGNQPNESIPEDTSVGEIIYYDLKNANIDMSEVKAVVPLAVYPQGFVQSIEAYENPNYKIELPKWYLGELKENYLNTDFIDIKDGFYVTPISDMSNVHATQSEWTAITYFAYLDDEIISYQARQKEEDGDFYVYNIIRGLCDTEIKIHLKGTKVWFSSVGFSDIRTLSVEKVNPTITFTPKNFKTFGESVTKSIEYNFNIEKPLLPQILSAKRTALDTIQIEISPRVRFKGANYREPDGIVYGEDEGSIEGIILVKWDNQQREYTHYLGDRIIFTNNIATEKDYEIVCILNGYEISKTIRI